MKTNELENFEVNVKIRLSALWTSLMFCYIYGDYFELYVPGKAEGMMKGQNLLDTPLKLLVATVMLTIPALMIFLSIMLNPKINKLLNLIFGAFFTALMLFIAFTSLTEWLAFYVFLALIESGITLIIIWQAWTWQKVK